MTNKFITFVLIGFVALVTSPLSFAQPPVAVTVTAVHYGGNVQYTYQVTNLTRTRSIVSVSIGNAGIKGDNPTTITNEQPELNIYPAGSFWGEPIPVGDNRGETPRMGGQFMSPLGWRGEIQGYQESGEFSLDWSLEDSNTKIYPVIRAGQTYTFGVTVPLNDDSRSPFSMSDPAYLNGHFTVGFDYSKVTDEGPAFWSYTGMIAPLDTTPPSLTVSMSSTTLPETDKLTPITATVNVRDDYDPAPEIKLDFITVNEVYEPKDIQNAALGTDDRQFLLKAEQEGKNPLGRIYIVQYSATDGSGNKAIATATVTVPPKQKSKEREERKSELRSHNKPADADKPFWKFW